MTSSEGLRASHLRGRARQLCAGWVELSPGVAPEVRRDDIEPIAFSTIAFSRDASCSPAAYKRQHLNSMRFPRHC